MSDSSTSALGTIAFIAVVLLIIFGGIWVFRRVHASTAIGLVAKWIIVGLTLTCGIGVSFISYFPDPDHEVDGFPVPFCILQREKNAWVDFVAPHAMIPVIGLINLFLVATAIHFIVMLWIFVRDRRAKSRGAGSTPSIDAGGMSM
jgi:hypothetical protein